MKRHFREWYETRKTENKSKKQKIYTRSTDKQKLYSE